MKRDLGTIQNFKIPKYPKAQCVHKIYLNFDARDISTTTKHTNDEDMNEKNVYQNDVAFMN